MESPNSRQNNVLKQWRLFQTYRNSTKRSIGLLVHIDKEKFEIIRKTIYSFNYDEFACKVCSLRIPQWGSFLKVNSFNDSFDERAFQKVISPTIAKLITLNYSYLTKKWTRKKWPKVRQKITQFFTLESTQFEALERAKSANFVMMGISVLNSKFFN